MNGCASNQPRTSITPVLDYVMNQLILFAILPWIPAAAPAQDRDRPNVIVIFTDDHGYADLSSQGIAADIQTPHIDSLAENGMRMSSGYVTAPQCVPSRAGLLSGRYQNRFGVESNGRPLDGFNAQQTIAERLKKAGYATGMTGKWHLGPQQEIVSHGFDDVYYKNSNRSGWANFDLDGEDRTPGVARSQEYHIDVASGAACAFIKRHRDEPFFFYCAYRAPHVPLDAPPKYLRRFPSKMPERRRQALAMLSAVDDGVGRIMATLREYGLEEKTLVFFIGDNGAPLKIHKLDAPGGGPGWDGSLNDPLNGEKGMLTEGGVRVPFVVSWKGRFQGGQVYDHPVSSLDVAATAVALAGLPADDQLDGTNLAPYLTGERKGAPHQTLYWRWLSQSAVREGKWKYLRGGTREYLFDLDADREEKHNLLTKHPEVAQRLKAKLTRWAAEMQPPGLAAKSASGAWDRYFDHYLDGKPAKPPEPGGSIQNWVARNSTARIQNKALTIVSAGARKRPFIARAKLKLDGPISATVRMRCANSGAAGFSWRNENQKDFPAGQNVNFKAESSDDWREYKTEFAAAS